MANEDKAKRDFLVFYKAKKGHLPWLEMERNRPWHSKWREAKDAKCDFIVTVELFLNFYHEEVEADGNVEHC